MATNQYTCDCTIIHKETVDRVKEKMLTDLSFEKATTFFKIIGDKTRMKILWALSQEEMCVCDMANLLSMSKSAISHQLKVLRENNLVKFDKRGKSVYYFLADEHVKNMIDNSVDHIH